MSPDKNFRSRYHTAVCFTKHRFPDRIKSHPLQAASPNLEGSLIDVQLNLSRVFRGQYTSIVCQSGNQIRIETCYYLKIKRGQKLNITVHQETANFFTFIVAAFKTAASISPAPKYTIEDVFALANRPDSI
jgi:hypothetical protein